jgi:hypothetical protein
MSHYFVKDFADGWIYFDNEADALLEVAATGARILVAHDPHRRFHHKVRRSTYAVLGDGEVQISVGRHTTTPGIKCRTLKEGDSLTVYQDAVGKLWLRFPDEMNDGRFEELTNDHSQAEPTPTPTT